MVTTHSFLMPPQDEHNQALVDHVHPADWVNPTPAAEYDLVVIGAGTAGLVAAAGAAGLDIGLKVALVERHLMGGDCLNVGCVPSKCLIRSSRAAADQLNTKPLGVEPVDHVTVDFPAVMERIRKVRAGISHHDSAQRFSKIGVDIFLGNGTFIDGTTIGVGDTRLRFKKAVIATGARATRPPVEGIEEVGFLTNETVFSLTERPDRLAVIGAGPIGCELAQAFQRLGSQVTLLHRRPYILNKEDPDAAVIVQKAIEEDGVKLVTGMTLRRAYRSETGKVLEFTNADGDVESVEVDEILMGAGRSPNVEGLNLESAGVQYNKRGVVVDDYLQTSNKRIFAAGDICMAWQFTHAADAAARIVLKNAFFSPFGLGKSKLSDLVMPWVTFTDPEVARTGLSAEEAQAKGLDTTTIKIDMSGVDRALTDGETDGFLKVVHKKGSDEILGATLVSRHAGETISELTTAIVNKIGLSAMSSVIHPYPTQADCVKRAADAYRRTLLKPSTKRLLGILTKLS